MPPGLQRGASLGATLVRGPDGLRASISGGAVMTWDEVLASGSKLPGTEASTSYGTPALKVNGRLVTRLRREDDSLVLQGVPPEEREVLMATDPRVFHVTPHYEAYPIVLARLAALEPERLWPFLVRRWREVAPKRAVAAMDARTGRGPGGGLPPRR